MAGRFNLGVERTLQAVLAALDGAGYEEAHAFIKREFYDQKVEEQTDWALKDYFGLSKRIIEEERVRKEKRDAEAAKK